MKENSRCRILVLLWPSNSAGQIFKCSRAAPFTHPFWPCANPCKADECVRYVDYLVMSGAPQRLELWTRHLRVLLIFHSLSRRVREVSKPKAFGSRATFVPVDKDSGK